MYLIIYLSRKNSALNSAANFSKVLISPEFLGDMVFFAIYRFFCSLHENLRQKNLLHIAE